MWTDVLVGCLCVGIVIFLSILLAWRMSEFIFVSPSVRRRKPKEKKLYLLPTNFFDNTPDPLDIAEAKSEGKIPLSRKDEEILDEIGIYMERR